MARLIRATRRFFRPTGRAVPVSNSVPSAFNSEFGSHRRARPSRAFDENSPDRRSAAGGYASATPSSVTNSRWLIRSPRRRGRAAAAAGPSSAVEFTGATLNMLRSTGDQRAEGRL